MGHIQFGVTIEDLGGRSLDDQALADAIMRRVAALLPSHMRGVYSDIDG